MKVNTSTTTTNNNNNASNGESSSFPKLIRYGKDCDANVISLSAEKQELIPILKQEGIFCYEFPDIDSETFELICQYLPNLHELPITEENVGRLNEAAATLGLQSLGTYCDQFYKRRVIFQEGSQQSYPIIQELYMLCPKLREQQTFPVLLEDCDETVLKVINAYAKDQSINLVDTIKNFDILVNIESYRFSYHAKILKVADFLEIKGLVNKCEIFIKGEIERMEERWGKRDKNDYRDIAENLCKYYKIADQYGFRDLKKRCKKIFREMLAEDLMNPTVPNWTPLERKNFTYTDVYLDLFQKYDISLKTFEAKVYLYDLASSLNKIFEKQNKIRTLTLHVNDRVEQLPSRELERNLKFLATNLNSFHITGKNLSIDSLAFLLPCQKLKNLGLQVKNVTNAIWPYLPFLKSLESIKFYADSVVIAWENLSTKKALTHLPQCENLKSIDFYEEDENNQRKLPSEVNSFYEGNEKFKLSESYLKQYLRD